MAGNGGRVREDSLGCGASLGMAVLAAALLYVWTYVLSLVAHAIGPHPLVAAVAIPASAGFAPGLLLGYFKTRGGAPGVAVVLGLALAAGWGYSVAGSAILGVESAPPQGAASGSLLAIAVGLIASHYGLAARGNGARRAGPGQISRRRALIRYRAQAPSPGLSVVAAVGLAALATLTLLGVSGLYARQQLAEVNDDIIPAVSDLLAPDGLFVEGMQANWCRPCYRMADDGSWFIFAETSIPRRDPWAPQQGPEYDWVARFVNRTPERVGGQPRSAEGLQVDGLELECSRAPSDAEAQDPARYAGFLRGVGVRPELAGQIAGSGNRSATRSGVTYRCYVHSPSSYRFFAQGIVIRCSGTCLAQSG